MGVEIPHYYDPVTGAPLSLTNLKPGYLEMNANRMVDWLHSHGSSYGWKVVTPEEAQAYANKGSPAVVISVNPDYGHVAYGQTRKLFAN